MSLLAESPVRLRAPPGCPPCDGPVATCQPAVPARDGDMSRPVILVSGPICNLLVPAYETLKILKFSIVSQPTFRTFSTIKEPNAGSNLGQMWTYDPPKSCICQIHDIHPTKIGARAFFPCHSSNNTNCLFLEV